MQFLKINILQGSVVTLSRCGDVCNNLFIADFLPSVTVKEFKKWSYFVEISTRVYLLFLLTLALAYFFEPLCMSVRTQILNTGTLNKKSE